MSLAVSRNVRGLALHDLFREERRFRFWAGAFAAIDEGLFAGERRQAFGQGQHLQDGGIAAILDGEGAGLFTLPTM